MEGRMKILNRYTQTLIKEINRETLGGANLGGADLRGADLRGADLGGANLAEADLEGANLRGADLRRANLRRANLRRANLGEADLEGANLDFSCWPLWCGSFDVKADDRLVFQLICHLTRLDYKNCSQDVKKAIKALRPWQDKFCEFNQEVQPLED
jgi:hypothetical protein